MTSTTANAVSHDLANARQPTPPSIKPVTDAVAQESARLGELARHWVDQGAAGYQDAMSTVRREAGALNNRTQSYVREEPVKAMVFAAAAGAAITGLALLFTRRR